MKAEHDYSTAGNIRRCLDKICCKAGVRNVKELCNKYGYSMSAVRQLAYRNSLMLETLAKICTDFDYDANEILGIPEKMI